MIVFLFISEKAACKELKEEIPANEKNSERDYIVLFYIFFNKATLFYLLREVDSITFDIHKHCNVVLFVLLYL